jgi:hypothetical protein
MDVCGESTEGEDLGIRRVLDSRLKLGKPEMSEFCFEPPECVRADGELEAMLRMRVLTDRIRPPVRLLGVNHVRDGVEGADVSQTLGRVPVGHHVVARPWLCFMHRTMAAA